MKKFIAGVVVGLMLSCAAVFAAPGNHDGGYWNKLNSSAKIGYVNGYSDAMRVSVGKLNILNTAASLFHWKGADKIIRQLSHELATSELRPRDAIKRLNALYSNRKYAELDLGTAFQLLTIHTPSDAASHGQAAGTNK